MNNKSIFIALFFSLTLSFTSSAQNADGMNMYLNERWSDAEKAFSSSSEEIDVFYKGVSQYLQENETEAKATFNSIASSPYGNIGLGLFEMSAGNTETAQDLFKKAEKATKSKQPEIFIAIGNAIRASKAEDKSIGPDWTKMAKEKMRRDPNFYINYGNTYLVQRDGGSAITQYEYALQNKANYPLAYAKIGQTYFRSRTVKLAKENLLKALQYDPNQLLALNYIAQLYYRTREFDSAEMYQSQLIKIGGETPEDMAMMANIYFLGEQYDKAIELINKIIEGDNKYNYLNRLIGYSYFETGKPQEAENFLIKFLETQPKDKIQASDYEYLAKSQLAIDPNSTEAMSNFAKAIEQDPTNRELITNIAKFYLDKKMYTEAIPYLEKLTTLEDATYNDFIKLGTTQFRTKQYEVAIGSFSKAKELNPNSLNAFYLSAAAKKLADKEQTTYSAKEDYLKVIELTQGEEDKYKKHIIKSKLYLAKDALKNEDDVSAQQYIDDILALDPGNAKATKLLEYLGGSSEDTIDQDDESSEE